MSTSATSGVWKHHKVVPETPAGFTMRGTVPTDENGVDVMMEMWERGSSEPPHSHPGDDMTVVIEGKMSVQFFKKDGEKLVEDLNRASLFGEKLGNIDIVKESQYLLAQTYHFTNDVENRNEASRAFRELSQQHYNRY